MPKNEKAEALIARLEEDPTQALRLAIATVLLAGFNAHPVAQSAPVSMTDVALSQADDLIRKTIGV